ncbi:condensation protein [Microcoleus sp. FACHB-831]|uniref:condensation domain-containing protein n=1 Tax=Microcoleus sp. FACHB-831 TaxID=2692827 RepID=UPI001688BC0B|nr:condensation domain-containing protein [Microcoleus sp. FACHB-831]MBD1924290.1 condensation protein [Microcoleus sp. FACHB-831]
MTTSNRLERLKNLSPEKRLLLLKALREEAAITEESNTIPRRSQLNPSPLSFAQQRLWFLAQLSPGNPAYNLPAAVSLKGQLNIAALEQTFQEIIQRHEVLRTNFALVDGEAVQVISDTATFTLPIINLQALADTKQQAEIQRLAVEEAQTPFNLSKELLLRGKLLQLSDSEYVLLFTMHHIISDGWSMGVLIREVAALYPAFCTAKSSHLPELPIQYADFAVWQRQYLQGEELDKQLSYWKQQLGGALPVLELPTDIRPTVPTFKGAQHLFVIPLSLTEAIKNLCQQEEVTLFMALLAGFQTLLYCYTKQEDIRLGSPIASRSRVELEGLIGFFVNTLVLRTNLSGNPTFRELLVRSRQVCLQAYAHQDVPFEKLVEELQPERKIGQNPLYQAWFVLQNTPTPPLELPGLTMRLLDSKTTTARHDLLLDIWESASGWHCTFEYKTDLFNRATISRIAQSFQTLLHQVVIQPNSNLSELATIIAETDKQQQLSQEQEMQTANIQKLKSIKRKAIHS